MQLVTPPGLRSWVYVSSRLAGDRPVEEIRHELRDRIFRVHAWLFDLDDNHAYSPAKVIAKRAIGTSHFN